MRLINRSTCGRPGYGLQARLPVLVLACLLVHLALFQLVDALIQSPSSSKLSLSLGNGNYNASHRGSHISRGQAVIASVPEEDRGMFIVYQLAKALNSAAANVNRIKLRIKVEPEIPQKKSVTFKDIWTYNTFPADLLKWTMQTFGWSQSDVYNLMRRNRVLCTSKGLCFNPNDIGSMCCPF